MKTIRDLGHFPVDPESIRKTGEFIKMTQDDALLVINGFDNPVLMKIFFSNDCVHVGEMVIPYGGIGPRRTEYDVHPGDAVFWVKEGTLTFVLPDIGQHFNVKAGEYMFIPENNRYQIINYYGEIATTLFIIAPEM